MATDTLPQLEYAARKYKPNPVPTIRKRIVLLLVKAMEETYLLAKEASPIMEEGAGDPPKVEYYRLMGDLAEVLDGVLENVSLDEMSQRLKRLEGYYNALQKGYIR